jgi:hypothetical protein
MLICVTLQSELHFGVDSTKLHTYDWLIRQQSGDSITRRRFHRIVFNFPHTGVSGSGDDSVSSNQALLRGFFTSARRLLRRGGEVHVSLRNSTYYQRWRIVEQAATSCLVLKEYVANLICKLRLSMWLAGSCVCVCVCVCLIEPLHRCGCRVEPFDAQLFAGYEAVRTASATLVRQAPATGAAQLYRFVRENDSTIDQDEDEEQQPIDTTTTRTKAPQHLRAKTDKLPKPPSTSAIGGDCSVYCSLCSVMCANQAVYSQHQRSKRHQKRATAMSVDVTTLPTATSAVPTTATSSTIPSNNNNNNSNSNKKKQKASTK